MPKRVDRAEQRHRIGAALLELIAQGGLEAVSVRTVAARSGRSPGAVQKYFSSRQEMLVFAAGLAGERIQARMAGIDTTGPALTTLRALVLTTLPVDPERHAEAVVQLAFAAQAVHHPELAEIRRGLDAEVREALAVWLTSLPRPVEHPLRVADTIIALADGLALRMLYTPYHHDTLLASLDHTLETLLP